MLAPLTLPWFGVGAHGVLARFSLHYRACRKEKRGSEAAEVFPHVRI
jgi:hypothetical protein